VQKIVANNTCPYCGQVLEKEICRYCIERCIVYGTKKERQILYEKGYVPLTFRRKT